MYGRKPKVGIPLNTIDTTRKLIEKLQLEQSYKPISIVVERNDFVSSIRQDMWYEYSWAYILGTTPYAILLSSQGELDGVYWSDISADEDHFKYEIIVFDNSGDTREIIERILIA